MKKIFLIFITLLFLFGLAFWYAAGTLSAPVYVSSALLPSSSSKIEIISTKNVNGWYVPSDEHKACVLLLHGVRASRKQMIGRASFLTLAGYSSLAIDLQAHGENISEKITFGYLESESARLAVNFLYVEKKCKKVVALGHSLGGAASVLGDSPLNVDGFILEAVYPTIENAVENRLAIRLGIFGRILAPLLYLQIPFSLGVELEDLRPSEAIKNIKAPLLIMNGSNDKRTTLAEARLLFNNAPQPKEFYEVLGAPHTNLYDYDRENYKKTVLTFLAKYI